MEINKRCISAFARNQPYVALATKSRVFDASFSANSELILVNYMTGEIFPAVITELKFTAIIWAEYQGVSYLAAGYEAGTMALYKLTPNGLVLVKQKVYGDYSITALEFFNKRSVIAAGTSKGNIIFWKFDDLDKEYFFAKSLDFTISSLSWNKNASKVMCVGSTEGIIKVIDVREGQIILTLTNKEFNEVKKVEWDPSNPMKFRVMSERSFLTEFDLSHDSISKYGEASDPLIGFEDKMYVTKNTLFNHGVNINIPDSIDFSISSCDPIICLGCVDGNTRIMSIPFVKPVIPFYQINSKIFQGTLETMKVWDIKLNNDSGKIDTNRFKFYIELFNESNRAEYLLKNAGANIINEPDRIKIDLNNKTTVSLIMGNMSDLNSCTENIPLRYLIGLLNKDINVLKEINDFNTLFVFSKLLNCYDRLGLVNMPRAAAVMAINNRISLDILNNSTEGRMICSVLENDTGKFIDMAVKDIENYPCRMKAVDYLVNELKERLSGKIRSEVLCEYYWYGRMMGKEKLEIEIDDKLIEFHKSGGKIIDQRAVQLDRNSNTSRTTELTKNPIPTIGSTISMKMSNMSVGSAASIGVNQIPMSGNSIPYAPGQFPVRDGTVKMGFGNSQIAANNMPLNTVSRSINTSTFPQNNMSNISSVMSNSTQQSGTYHGWSKIPDQPSLTVNNYPPSMNRTPVAPQASIPFSAPIPAIPVNFNTPSIPGMSMPPKSPSFSGIPQPGMGSVPMRSPVMTTPVRPPIPGIPTSNMRTPSFTPSPSTQNIRQPSFSGIPQQVSNSNISGQSNSFGMGSPNISSPNSTPTFQTNGSTNQVLNSVSNPQEVLFTFDSQIRLVLQKSESLTSLIFKSRKIQYSSLLHQFLEMDKSTISNDVLYIIQMISNRFKSQDSMLKNDIDSMISGYTHIPWLKAFVEMVKMVY